MRKALKKVLVCTLAAALTFGSASAAGAATQSPTTSVQPTEQNDVKVGRVTVDTADDGTASLVQVAKTTKKSVTVASTVTVNGVKYTVTTIGAKAFANAKKAKKITLPATIKTISKNAFTGAKALKTITLKGTKSITIKKGAFKGLNTKKMTIKVSKKMPKKQLKKLKTALKKAGFKGKVKAA